MFGTSYDPSTWIPYLIVIFDLLKGLAWPAAVPIVALIFRRELKEIFPRLIRIGRDGIEMQPADQNAHLPDDIELVKWPAVNVAPMTDPVALEIEDRNRKSLQAVPQDEREETLLRALTIQQISKSFGIAYAHIFGSQIRTLKQLNIGPIPRWKADQMFIELKAKNAAFQTWTLDQYVRFLLAWRFVEEGDGTFQITETGRNFLQFIVGNGLSEDRLN